MFLVFSLTLLPAAPVGENVYDLAKKDSEFDSNAMKLLSAKKRAKLRKSQVHTNFSLFYQVHK